MIKRALLQYVFNKLYSDRPLIDPTLSILDPTSKKFESDYKEARYKIMEQFGPEGRGLLKKLSVLDVNYLNRKINISKDKATLNGRVFQSVYTYTMADLVGEVISKRSE